MRIAKCVWALAGILLACRFAQVGAADTVRIAFIDPLSGTFANIGELEVRSFLYAIDGVNARGGVRSGSKLELATFDNKANPQDALLALKQATDQGIRFVTQGNSSAVALALSDAIAKHNAHDPDHSVLLLNYGANDPALTNERCSFWHFRFDADADMRMSALTDTIAANKNVSKVYLINQDYSAGHAVAKAARAMLAQKRPDISIVGDDFHPLGKVKDFSPYIAKIKASGADSVITQNWGNDLVLLVKAASDAGLNVDYYTYYASGAGTLTALDERALGRIKEVGTYNQNPSDERAVKYIAEYREKYKEAAFDPRPGVVIEMLAQAIDRADSTDPAKVARALEGMTYHYLYGPVQMRADNHQLVQPLFITFVARVDGRDVKFDSDHSGMGWKAERRIEGKDTIMPTTCKMQRPQ
jgi:branched-chain amino acid transport system substrate-binding protein